MSEKRYIHIRQWDTFQHPDVTRNRRHAAPWIKQFTGQLSNEDYVALSYADRGLLESLRIQYALNRGRGIDQNTSNLQRVLGQRVLSVQLERLSNAGFIEISASKGASDLQATSLKKTRLEVDVDRDTDVEGESEEPLTNQSTEANHDTNGRLIDQELNPDQINELLELAALKDMDAA